MIVPWNSRHVFQKRHVCRGEMSDKGAMEAGRLGVMLLMYSIVADMLVPSR